jgi:hypothetical protein
MRPPTDRDLRRARDEFRDMLDRPTNEPQWQKFFAANPYVLSMALPLRVAPQEIIPLGRPGRAEPDFIFFPKDPQPIPTYGVIELKRPDSKIIAVTRSNVAVLTRDADTAIQQARMYASARPEFLLNEKRETLLMLGLQPHLFVIMGMSAELGSKLGSQLYRDMIEKRLPRNLRLIPFDALLREFEIQVPRRVHVLVPAAFGAEYLELGETKPDGLLEGAIHTDKLTSGDLLREGLIHMKGKSLSEIYDFILRALTKNDFERARAFDIDYTHTYFTCIDSASRDSGERSYRGVKIEIAMSPYLRDAMAPAGELHAKLYDPRTWGVEDPYSRELGKPRNLPFALSLITDDDKLIGYLACDNNRSRREITQDNLQTLEAFAALASTVFHLNYHDSPFLHARQGFVP